MSQSNEPTGLLQAFLFADIRGYTAYTSTYGNKAASELAAKFMDTAQEVLAARGASTEGKSGDGVFYTFASIEQALRAAVELQHKVHQLAASAPALRVGIGIAAGDAISSEHGMHAAPINRAARLCGEALAGEVRVDQATADLAGTIPGLAYSEVQMAELKGIGDVHYVLVTAHDAGSSVPAIPGTSIKEKEVRSRIMTELRSSAPRQSIDRALATSLAQIPEEHRGPPAVFRWMACWPEPALGVPVGLETLQRAIAKVSAREASVWALMRYHDYARWNPNRMTLGNSSEQQDPRLPWFVHWEVSRFGFAFQHSEQPGLAGEQVSGAHTAVYCTRAVDFVGAYFTELGIVEPVTLLICISGTRRIGLFERLAGQNESMYADLDLNWWQSYTADAWRQRRHELAVAFARDLLLQASASHEELNAVEVNVGGELQGIDEVRQPLEQ